MTTKAQPAQQAGIGQITRFLEQMREGDPKAAEQLLSHVYRELRALAAGKMSNEAPGHTLQPTALVHEVWLRLMGGDGQRFPDRAYFFAAAGEAMRRILVENARRKKRLKRGGNLQRVEIEKVDLPAPLPDDDLLALDEALTRLAESDPRAAEVVKLCFFVEMTQEQAAKELGVSISTVERTWAFARAWLFREIQESRNPQV
jgi:RNA polymerase sigma factor (TIGR02999 family)